MLRIATLILIGVERFWLSYLQLRSIRMWHYATVVVAYFNNQFDFSASICKILVKTWPSDGPLPFFDETTEWSGDLKNTPASSGQRRLAPLGSVFSDPV